MTITLWGRLNAVNVQKAVWALGELELPFEHVTVGGAWGGNNSPEYLAMNPMVSYRRCATVMSPCGRATPWCGT